MYIPSGLLSKAIQSEQIGVWSETYDNGNSAALLIKVPSTTLKAIIQGCDVELIIGHNTSDKEYLIIGLRVFDSTDSHVLIPTPTRSDKEISGIFALVENQEFNVTIYDEMDAPVCSAKGRLTSDLVKTASSMLEDISKYSPVNNMTSANEVIDSFAYTIDPAYGTSKYHESRIESCRVTLSDLTTIPIISSSECNSVFYQIDTKDEGLTQEQQLAHALCNNFLDDVYHSPQVTTGKKTRELIDVLTFDDRSTYLIESKALCINDSGHDIPIKRKLAKSIKHAHRALGQLEGAIKAVDREDNITTSSGEQLLLENKTLIHGIVIISEFIPSERWNEIVEKLISISKSTQTMMHVIDLSEFINTIKLSQHPTVSFEQCLIERYEAVVEHRTLNIMGTNSELPFSL